MILSLILAVGVLAAASLIIAITFRVVVPTNDVHIVQSAKTSTSYGKGETAGNVYYAWPASLPKIGVRVIKLPVSVFDLHLSNYASYDKGRVPFVVDIMAFFRIEKPEIAAKSVHTVEELNAQLQGILQSAARAILSSCDIEEILEGRSAFGERFTKEVDHHLEAWGVKTVKSIEFMDIRDSTDSQVIHNIMAKKKSLIEMHSRTEVAQNMKVAQQAEIAAQREVEMQKQDAIQQVGQRTATKDREVGIANEQAKQMIQDQQKVTAEKSMAVKKVNEVMQAEITKNVQVVLAQQTKETTVIKAEGEKQVAITMAEGNKQNVTLVAEGNLAATQLAATGIAATGAAKAEAEKLLQLAPVQAQITLAKEIGSNEPYQKYLLTIREIEKNEQVGIKQAEAIMDAAEVKILVNGGTPAEGINNVMGLMTPQGGLQIGGMLEALKNTDAGAAVLSALSGGKKPNGDARR